MPLAPDDEPHLEPGTGSLEELISEVDEGLFLQTNRSWCQSTTSAGLVGMAYDQNGKLGRLLRDASLTGISALGFARACRAPRSG